jgi:hypothetical protein
MALNISDPLNITEVSRVNGYGGEGLYVDDSYAYLSCTYEHSGLFVIDFSDSSRPAMRDSINPEGVEEWEPYVPHSPGYGYLADEYGGLVTVDVHDVNNLSEAWSGYKAGMSVDVDVDNNRAYIANSQSGLQIVDVTDPKVPMSLGVFDIVGAKVTSTATARDSFAFIGMSGISRREDMRVLDVLDPSNPTVVAQESCFNPPEDMVLRDSFVYCAEAYEFQVFNVARPREPVRVGSCVLGDVWDLDVEDTMAYVTSNALTMISIARPDSPRVVGTWNTMVAVDVEDTIAYTVGSGAVWAVSVARASRPYILDTVRIAGWVSDVVVGGSLAFAGGQVLYVIDKRDPRNVRIVGRWTPPEEFRRLFWSPPYIYAACYDAGVCILETLPTGIAERGRREAEQVRNWASVVRGVLFMSEARGEKREVRSELRDISGRKVADLHPGANDVRALAPGVYFVRAASREPLAVGCQKVVVTR